MSSSHSYMQTPPAGSVVENGSMESPCAPHTCSGLLWRTETWSLHVHLTDVIASGRMIFFFFFFFAVVDSVISYSFSTNCDFPLHDPQQILFLVFTLFQRQEKRASENIRNSPESETTEPISKVICCHSLS